MNEILKQLHERKSVRAFTGEAIPGEVKEAILRAAAQAPTAQQQERPKPERAAMEHIVHENAYRRREAGELEEMLSYKSGANTYESWIKAFCSRKYNSDFSREMTRSVAKYLESFEK